MLILSMLFLLGYSLFYVYSDVSEVVFIGASQQKILEAKELAERVTLYLDASVSAAAKRASLNLRNDGGFSLSRYEDEVEIPPCGTMVYPLLNEGVEVEKCLVVENAYQRNFEQEFNLLVAKFPELALYNFGFDISSKKIGQTVSINIVSRENIEIPIYAFSAFYTDPVVLEERVQSAPTAGFTKNEFGYQERGGLTSISRGSQEMDRIVLHYTVTKDVETAYKVLMGRGLSYSYIIEKDGTIYQFVDDARAAQHAGCSGKAKDKCPVGYNQRSIGISFVSCGFNDPITNAGCAVEQNLCYTGAGSNGICWESYTTAQETAVANLIADIAYRQYQKKKVFPINEQTVIYHSDVDKGKVDPGPAFNKNAVLAKANEIYKLKLQSVKSEDGEK